MNASLLRALRMVIRADSDPARQVLFASLMQGNLRVRLAYGVHERLRGTWASALLVSCYGVASFLTIAPAANRRARVLAVAKHANARCQVSRVVKWLGQPECDWVRADIKTLASASAANGLVALLPATRRRRALRIVRRIDRHHGFLVSCRAAAAMAWYVRAGAILSAHQPRAVLVSSDSHPEELGFVAAARARTIPSVFISHAYPTPLSPPLDFSLSILEGNAAVNARRQKGPVKGDVLLAGLEGESAPIDPRRFERPEPVIGIFPPKVLSWPTFAAIVDDCRRHFRARQIVIRWHPSMLTPPRLRTVLSDLSGIVESPRAASLPEVARGCDWVVADENSNVHLPVLKLGIPTVAVKGLGLYPRSRSDLYGFINNGIVLPPVASIRDIDARTLAAFFDGGWSARFTQYDASYLRAADDIGDAVRREVQALLDGHTLKAEACLT